MPVFETITLDIAASIFLVFRNFIIELRNARLALSGVHERPPLPMRILPRIWKNFQGRNVAQYLGESKTIY
jgi:hypothetical protein